MIPIIDGDVLVYTLGYASEDKGEFVDGSTFHVANPNLAKRLIKSTVRKYLSKFDPGVKPLVVISGSSENNWRLGIYSEYKANRKTLTKPLAYRELRQYFQEELQARTAIGELMMRLAV